MIKPPPNREAIISSVRQYLHGRLGIEVSDYAVSDIDFEPGRVFVCLKTFHRGTPRLVVFDREQNTGTPRLIPYHPVRERPDRQIMSYLIGKDLSNLAELVEMDGKLYSRSCLSHDPELIYYGNMPEDIWLVTDKGLELLGCDLPLDIWLCG